jgi:Leucine-rich repeat (LRR) protein
LERLDLSHNELTYLPTYLGHFSNLKKLRLDANPLESIPAEIKKGKLSGLLSYLRVRPILIHALTQLHQC